MKNESRFIPSPILSFKMNYEANYETEEEEEIECTKYTRDKKGIGDETTNEMMEPLEFVCPPRTPFTSRYLFASDKDRNHWEQLPFRAGTFSHICRRESIAAALKVKKCAIYVSLHTEESWSQMMGVRDCLLKRGSQTRALYGSMVPLKSIKGLRLIYTLDWNIETGRVMGIGYIVDPANTISNANTNGRSVNMYSAPYGSLNSYVYGGPRWTPRADFSDSTRATIHALEQMVHERPFLPYAKKRPAPILLFASGGLKPLPVKYMSWVEEKGHMPLDVVCEQAIQKK